MDFKPLTKSFYDSLDALSIARELLGTIIVTNIDNKTCIGMIVETEAYMAPADLASHAKGNKRTPRTETMFGAPGTAYVYKCYGIHDLFNIVTGPIDVAHVILIRAIQPLEGIQWMEERRKVSRKNISLANGPGKLTSALGIGVADDGLDLTDHAERIVVCENPGSSDFRILEGPRVGMSQHTRDYGYKPWRYRIANNKWTSKPDKVTYNW